MGNSVIKQYSEVAIIIIMYLYVLLNNLIFFFEDELIEIAERTKIPIHTVKKYYNDYMVYKLLNIFLK